MVIAPTIERFERTAAACAFEGLKGEQIL